MEYIRVDYFRYHLDGYVLNDVIIPHHIKIIKQELARRYVPYTVENVKKVLKYLKYYKYLKYSCDLYRLFVNNGRETRLIVPQEIKDRMIACYKLVNRTFYRLFPNNSFFQYAFVLRKIMEILNAQDYFNKENLIQKDKYSIKWNEKWKTICDVLHFPYIESSLKFNATITIQRYYKKHLAKKISAATIIQKKWLCMYYNPNTKIC